MFDDKETKKIFYTISKELTLMNETLLKMLDLQRQTVQISLNKGIPLDMIKELLQNIKGGGTSGT